MSEEETSVENLRVVYSEANNNRRHYSNLRFAILSVFFAVLGGLSSVAFGIVEIKSPSPARILLGARIAGLLFTGIFFSFDILCDLHLRYFGKAAEKLEDSLGYNQMKGRKPQFIRGFHVARGMYMLLILFWVISIYRCA